MTNFEMIIDNVVLAIELTGEVDNEIKDNFNTKTPYYWCKNIPDRNDWLENFIPVLHSILKDTEIDRVVLNIVKNYLDALEDLVGHDVFISDCKEITDLRRREIYMIMISIVWAQVRNSVEN